MSTTTAKTGKELAKNTVIISVGKICTQAVSFLLLPIYTGILSREEYGMVDLFLTYTSLLLPIFTLQLEQALFRFIIDRRGNDADIKKVSSAIFTLLVLAMLAFTAIFIPVSLFIDSELKYYLFINMLTSTLSLSLLQMARGLGKNFVYAVGSFLSATAVVVLNIAFILGFNMGAYGMIWSHILASLFSMSYTFFAIRAYKYIRLTKFSKSEFKTYLGYSLPLVPNQLSWWILSASDRSVILWMMGVAFNGIYSIAGKFSSLYATMFNIFNLSWTELISLHFKDENRQKVFSELQDTVVKLLISIYLLMVAVMPFVFPIMIDKKYDDAYYQIPILMLGMYFSAMIGVMSAYYIADKKTVVIARTTMICAAINLGLDIALMPMIGLYAASCASAVAYIIMYIVRYIDINKKYGVSNTPQVLILSVASSVIVFVCYYTRNLIICAVCLAAVAAMSLWINRKIAKSVLNMVKKKLRGK